MKRIFYFFFQILFAVQSVSAQQYGIIASSIQLGGGGSNPGILDTITNASLAYSMRHLLSTYTGDCMQIERASDNTTSEIGFVGDTCDIASINSFCSGTTCWVNIWYDQSGNGRDAYGMNYGSTTDNLPIIYESGSITKNNGRVAIKITHPRAFVWTDTGTDIGDLLTGGAVNTDKKVTISVVGLIGSTPTQPYLFSFDDNTDGTEILWWYSDGNARIEFVGTAASMGTGFTRSAQKNWIGQVDGNDFTGYENGSTLGTSTNGSVQNPTKTGIFARMGGGSFSSRNIEGFYQEVINWKTAENITTIWNSCDAFWNIP